MADRTELELELDNPNGEKLGNLFNRITQHNSTAQTKLNFGLNFGSNEISTITDLSFHNNKRIGEIVQSVQHPRDSFPSPGSTQGVNEETFFSPSFDSKDDNYWIEFIYLKTKHLDLTYIKNW